METIFGYKTPGVESSTDKSFILKATYIVNDNRKTSNTTDLRLHFHRGQTQKPTSHPAVIALKNLYQFKLFTEQSS